jgi:hypothetical protein
VEALDALCAHRDTLVQVVLDYFDRKLNENRSESDRLQVMLVCGSDLLASFNMPGVWADEDVPSHILRVCLEACIAVPLSSSLTMLFSLPRPCASWR